MGPLERLFVLEIEFHRRLRCEKIDNAELSGLHTSYALQLGYEELLCQIGRASAAELERLTEQYNLAGDIRDVLKARDSVAGLMGLQTFDD